MDAAAQFVVVSRRQGGDIRVQASTDPVAASVYADAAGDTECRTAAIIDDAADCNSKASTMRTGT